jgi:uncharacterized protein
MVEIKVKGLAQDSQSGQMVVILTDPEERRYLPIWIGLAEADAILIALEKIPLPRPGTHDLLKNILDTLGGKLDRVVIHSIKESIYYATLHLISGDKKMELDSRPSDAIALALRAEAPVFVSEAVMGQAAILDKTKAEKDMEEFRKFIDTVKPADFIKYDNTHPHLPPEAGEGKKENLPNE